MSPDLFLCPFLSSNVISCLLMSFHVSLCLFMSLHVSSCLLMSLHVLSRVIRDPRPHYVGPSVSSLVGWSPLYFFAIFELFVTTAPAQML